MQADEILKLIGALGLPGSVASLLVAFYFGIRIKNIVQWNGKERRSGVISYKGAATMVRDVSSLVDRVKTEMIDEVKRNRHDIRNELAVFGGNLQSATERGFERIAKRLDQLESGKRR